MDSRRQQQIEQIEIIERTVTESCRPLAAAEVLAFQPQCSVRTSTEKFVSTGPDSAERFQLTSERDVGQDSSLLYSPSGGQISFVRDPPLHQSTPQSAVVNQYGYDVHEVQTSEGGARVMETHGAGHAMLEHSMAETSGDQLMQQRSPPERLHSILKPMQQSSAEAADMSSESSVHRKDSYKRMQEAEQQQQNLSSYAQSSNATILSKQSRHGPTEWTGGRIFGAGRGEGTFARLKNSSAELGRQFREGEWTPRLVVALVLIALFIVLFLLLLWFVLSALFLRQSTYSFLLFPPVCEECQKLTGSGYRPPSKLYVHLHSPAQAHFELVGNPPFKSNSFTAVDFDTGFVAIADHSLTDDHGKHITCFLMQLDRSALPDMDTLVDALGNTYGEVHAQFGWQEYWQFTVESVDSSFVASRFKDRIEDCQGVQWYLLKQSIYTKDESCAYCYDFCLPDYSVLRRQKYEDEISLGIRRLNCFRLYVAEWSKYTPKNDDASGGHFGYPKHHLQNTQRDANGNWLNWQYEQSPASFNNRQRRRLSSRQK